MAGNACKRCAATRTKKDEEGLCIQRNNCAIRVGRRGAAAVEVIEDAGDGEPGLRVVTLPGGFSPGQLVTVEAVREGGRKRKMRVTGERDGNLVLVDSDSKMHVLPAEKVNA